MSFNRLIVVGKLGKNPQLKFTHSGYPICYLALLSKETVQDKIFTTWYQVILLGSQAEQAEKNLAKGNTVYVEGRLRPQEIKDKHSIQY
jgi:single-strand DNA-binding protein